MATVLLSLSKNLNFLNVTFTLIFILFKQVILFLTSRQTIVTVCLTMNSINKELYQTLGLQPWELRRDKPTLLALKQQVARCTACALHTTRTQTVFGVGSETAALMIVGEAPGFHEDQQGEPFVGRAGQLLTAMLKALSLTREQVYIANILKCRPPNNRDPSSEEVATCTQFLNQQIDFIQPRLILAVGRIAAHYLLQTKSSLESMRNKIHQYGKGATQTPLIVTYHPAYLLRSPADKKKAFLDLQFTQTILKNHTGLSFGSVTHGKIS